MQMQSAALAVASTATRRVRVPRWVVQVASAAVVAVAACIGPGFLDKWAA
jgi:hypothetical protein